MNPQNKDSHISLSLEQEFILKTHEKNIKNLSNQQCQELILDLLRQMMIKDNLIKSMIKRDMLPFS